MEADTLTESTPAASRTSRGAIRSFSPGAFAAKEAVAKALGTGIGDVGWLEIEILGDEQNAPTLILSGAAKKRAADLGLSDWSVSISHSMTHAVAIAVAIGKSRRKRLAAPKGARSRRLPNARNVDAFRVAQSDWVPQLTTIVVATTDMDDYGLAFP